MPFGHSKFLGLIKKSETAGLFVVSKCSTARRYGGRSFILIKGSNYNIGESCSGYCIRNLNPDSICCLYDEMLRVLYAAYPNMEKKNCIHTTMTENLNIKLKNVHNDKRFKKKICSINSELRKCYAWS
jgi:hypothetical protein